MTKTRNKRIWLLPALALMVLAGLEGWFWWERAHRPPPQIIAMPDGTRFRFAGVTSGRRNVPPSFQLQLLDRLPTRLSDMLKKRLGARITPYNGTGQFDTPHLFVWFQLLGTNIPYSPATGPITVYGLLAQLSDETGVPGGVPGNPMFSHDGTWTYAAFGVVPRRSRTLQLSVLEANLDRLSFRNPFYGHFRQWQPEPLPAVKPAGDLQVRLESVTNGLVFQTPQMRFAGTLNSPSGSNESWVLHGAELSDATGNVIHSGPVNLDGLFHAQPNAFSASLRGTLWPDEAACRLKLEFKRASGHAPADIVIFKNVPVPALGATNAMRLTNTVAGMQIVLAEFVHRRDINYGADTAFNYSHIKVELPAQPAGVAIDFLTMTADSGPLARAGSWQDGSAYVLNVESIPAWAKTMDLTFAVQKTRSVEFLVAPPKPK